MPQGLPINNFDCIVNVIVYRHRLLMHDSQSNNIYATMHYASSRIIVYLQRRFMGFEIVVKKHTETIIQLEWNRRRAKVLLQQVR